MRRIVTAFQPSSEAMTLAASSSRTRISCRSRSRRLLLALGSGCPNGREY
jgi:hypothetical protein